MEVLHLGVSLRIGLSGGVSFRSLLPLLRFLATSHGGIGIVALRSVLEIASGILFTCSEAPVAVLLGKPELGRWLR
jgi:hypothetical protein